jgi:hypothetical protein
MGLYRVTREDGSVEYTDVPSGDGQIQAVRSGSAKPADEAQRREDAKTAETLIREAQKRIPKLADYFDYLDYLRHHSPVKFDRVMAELRREDPQTWLKLQKYPQFRPLRETALGIKAGSNLLGAGVALSTGKFTGSVEKWMESTLKDLMKRDRFGPYADVLGAKVTTLPTKEVTYSNSRLGQHLKTDSARLAAASQTAAKELDASKAAMRAARGTAVVRSVGPIVDLGLAALRPESAAGATAFLMRQRLERAARRNPSIDLDTPAYDHARRLLSEGRYDELDEHLKQYE